MPLLQPMAINSFSGSYREVKPSSGRYLLWRQVTEDSLKSWTLDGAKGT